MSLLRQVAKATFAATDLLLPTPEGPRILIYHNVGTRAGKQMEVSPEDFIWQLNWLVSNREIVDLETAVRRWTEPDADQMVVLTFDDGYQDTYTTAFPLMRERGIPFTLYLATDMIESRPVIDVHPLAWEQIKEMMETGLLTLGAHTHSHRDLRAVEYAEALEELEVSNDIIEQRTGVTPLHFAYPWGYWAEQAHRAVAETYETAVLGAPLWRSDFDAHQIFRFPIQLSDGARWFNARLRGGLLMEEWTRRRLRGYSGP